MTKSHKRVYLRVAVLAVFLGLMGCHASASIGTTSHVTQVQ
jgi:hypothetical protein